MVPLENLCPGSAVVGEPVAVLADLGVGADQPLDLRVGGAVVRAPVGLPPQFVSLKVDKQNVPSTHQPHRPKSSKPKGDILGGPSACRERFRVFTFGSCFKNQPAGRNSYFQSKAHYSGGESRHFKINCPLSI